MSESLEGSTLILVASAIHRASCEWDLDECLATGEHTRAAQEVLDALAEAGKSMQTLLDVTAGVGQGDGRDTPERVDERARWTADMADILRGFTMDANPALLPGVRWAADYLHLPLTGRRDPAYTEMDNGDWRQEWAVRVDQQMPARMWELPGTIITHFGAEKSQRCREFWRGWTPMVRTVSSWREAAGNG